MSKPQPLNNNLQINLTKDESLVLFDLLDGNFFNFLKDSLEDKNKLWSLIKLSGFLERNLTEPFMKEYKTLVAKSLEKIVEQNRDLNETF